MVNIPFKTLFALLLPHVALLLVSCSPQSDNNAGGSRKFKKIYDDALRQKCFRGLPRCGWGAQKGNRYEKSFRGVFI